MLRTKPFPFSVFVLVCLVTLHGLASHYSWYWSYPWFDIVIHILSGLWIALVVLALATYLDQIDSLKEYRVKSFLIALFSAVLIGVVWELLESFGQLTFTTAAGYGADTAFDIMSDAIGGVLAYFYFIQKKKCVVEEAPNLHPFYNQVRHG